MSWFCWSQYKNCHAATKLFIPPLVCSLSSRSVVHTSSAASASLQRFLSTDKELYFARLLLFSMKCLAGTNQCPCGAAEQWRRGALRWRVWKNMAAILNLISPLNKEITDVPGLRAEGVGSENRCETRRPCRGVDYEPRQSRASRSISQMNILPSGPARFSGKTLVLQTIYFQTKVNVVIVSVFASVHISLTPPLSLIALSWPWHHRSLEA